ncbi:MAG: hypothetical protein M1358_23300 [Chloroflexi bacterium]|nr:hypothetical protein [Chloroflexota bacterium]
MPAAKQRVFEKCPLCHSAAMGGGSTKLDFWRSVKASTCSVCGALFVSSGHGRLRLQRCDPARLGAARGKKRPQSGCGGCLPLSECYLDRSLTLSDWEHISKGEPTESQRAFIERRAKMEAGDLPVLPTEQSPVPIEAGEQLHHVSTVYTCEQPLPGESRDEGKLVVTSQRIVLVHEGASLDVGLDEIDRLEKAFPGFLVYVKGSPQPFCFFPRRDDPVFYAIETALLRTRGEK